MRNFVFGLMFGLMFSKSKCAFVCNNTQKPPLKLSPPLYHRKDMPQIQDILNYTFLSKLRHPNVTCDYVSSDDLYGKQKHVNYNIIYSLLNETNTCSHSCSKNTPKVVNAKSHYILVDGNHHVSACIMRNITQLRVYVIHNRSFEHVRHVSDTVFGLDSHNDLCG